MKRFVLLVLAALPASCAHPASTPLPPLSALQSENYLTTTTTPLLYVTNDIGSSVTEFTLTAKGNIAPSRMINGTNTALDQPFGISLGSTGQTFVTNFGNNTVTVYAAAAAGNAKPIRTIRCGGLDGATGTGLDASGNLYVANQANNSISVFTATANGCISGNRIIKGSSTLLSRPTFVQVSGTTLFVSNSNGITEYAATAKGNTPPIKRVSGGNTGFIEPEGIGFDASKNLYVCDIAANAVFEFNAGVQGNVHPNRAIRGNATQLHNPSGLAISGTTLFVTNTASNSVTAYTDTANGNVLPLRTIMGAATQINYPGDAAIH